MFVMVNKGSSINKVVIGKASIYLSNEGKKILKM
ncbi:hypothetical protein EDC19_2559 [Natranaerovirga hydrolytica]|uniref:Uncharacterized protein n=1 Tax=Natranaerovirga hydrolytica TaxID=680378 RepID=A0A4V2PZB0_9FIRM|nr:hypothetical protein EDC19_2559 [Natranaerovirga hydrolytica]